MFQKINDILLEINGWGGALVILFLRIKKDNLTLYVFL